MNQPEPARPPQFGGNMIFFTHYRNADGCMHFPADGFVKPGFCVTLAYSFIDENHCMAAVSIKSPVDKFVRKTGNSIALGRLVKGLEGNDDGKSHIFVVDSTDGVNYLTETGGYHTVFSRLIFTTKSQEQGAEEFRQMLSGIPIKLYNHQLIREVLIRKAHEVDIGVAKAIKFSK